MLDSLEDFMNRLTELDWGWWPVVFLRPPKNKDIDNRVLFKMTLFFGTVAGVAIWLILYWRFKVTAWSSIALTFILGWFLFFLGYKLTFAYFWNRRARRLRKSDKKSIEPRF